MKIKDDSVLNSTLYLFQFKGLTSLKSNSFFKIHCIYSIILWSPRYVGMNENHYHDKYFWKSILQFLHRSCEATICLMLVLKCFLRTVNTYLHQHYIYFKRTLIYYLLLCKENVSYFWMKLVTILFSNKSFWH